MVDVGSGAGFPGLPLKIMMDGCQCPPSEALASEDTRVEDLLGNPVQGVTLVLMEVSKKKQEFLRAVISELGLENVEIVDIDWRTFLRKTSYEIDLFLARASLQPEELLRMFKPGSPYKHATLIYWAAKQWEAEQKVALFVKREEPYTVGDKKRKLVFFALK